MSPVTQDGFGGSYRMLEITYRSHGASAPCRPVHDGGIQPPLGIISQHRATTGIEAAVAFKLDHSSNHSVRGGSTLAEYLTSCPSRRGQTCMHAFSLVKVCGT